MSYTCEWCGTVATYRNNIKTHLCGAGSAGGHELTDTEAESVISSIEGGFEITVEPRAMRPGVRLRKPLPRWYYPDR